MNTLSLLASIVFSHNFTAQNIEVPLTINVDTTLAQKILQTVCSSAPPDRVYFSQSQDIRNMLDHFSQFRSYFTLENYFVELEAASRCEKTESDYFRFNQLVEQKPAIASELTKSTNRMDAEVAQLVAPYTPAGSRRYYQAVLMVGTPSCGGWSSRGRFFVDLPCIQNDPEGLLYLIAHETYHLIQADVMPRSDETNFVARFLEDMIKEGSAMVVADMTRIEHPGSYTQKSLTSIRKNQRRNELNLALFELLLTRLVEQPDEATWKIVYNIGFSGSYDAPMYSVGANIIRVVIEKYGNEQYLEWLDTQPLMFVSKYAELTEQAWLAEMVNRVSNAAQNAELGVDAIP